MSLDGSDGTVQDLGDIGLGVTSQVPEYHDFALAARKPRQCFDQRQSFDNGLAVVGPNEVFGSEILTRPLAPYIDCAIGTDL